MKTLVLALICLLVPPANQKHNGEDEDAASARYAVIADAVADESGADRRLAAFLLTVARHESAFVRTVHTGKRRGDRGRSWGLFQIMCGLRADSVVPATEYRAREIVGVNAASTRRAVDAAAVHLRKHIKRCKGQPTCVFKSYGGVSRTGDKRIVARVNTYHRLTAEIRKAQDGS